MVLVLAVAQPLVGDAMTERVADLAVDDEELAVRAVIETPQIPPARTTINAQVHVARDEALQLRVVRARTPERVDEDADRDADASLLAEQVDELAFDFALGPHERFEMNGVSRRRDVGEHGGKQSAVLQDRDAIAFVHGAAGQPGQRFQAVFDRGQRIQIELQVRRAPAMSEAEVQRGERRADQRRNDRGHHRRSMSAYAAVIRLRIGRDIVPIYEGGRRAVPRRGKNQTSAHSTPQIVLRAPASAR